MSRHTIVLSITFATLLAGSELAVIAIRGDFGRLGQAPGNDTDRPLAALEEKIEDCFRLVEKVLGGDVAASRSSLAGSNGVAAAESPAASELTPIEALLARFDDLERRLESLQRDPLLLGVDFMESADPKLRRRGIRALKRIAAYDPKARDAIRAML